MSTLITPFSYNVLLLLISLIIMTHPNPLSIISYLSCQLLIVLQQPGIPLQTTVHLGDHPTPVIGMGCGPNPMQYATIQQQQQQLRMGPGPRPGPMLAQGPGLMQGPGPGSMMMAPGPGLAPGPPYGMQQGQVMGNMYMSNVPVRAGPYHQR